MFRWRLIDAALVGVSPGTCCVRRYPGTGVSVRQRARVIRLSRRPAAAVEHVIRSHVVLSIAVETSQVVNRLAADYNMTKHPGADTQTVPHDTV